MVTLIAEDGVGLYAESHGDGIPVILSNGLCTTCENFRPQVEAFVDAGVQLILWDYRGHGRSESPDDPAAYTLDRVLSDLGRVLDWAAPGRRAVLGGSSFGGLASLHFAYKNPQRVRGLILIGLLFNLVIYPIFAGIGSMIGVAIFNKKPLETA